MEYNHYDDELCYRISDLVDEGLLKPGSAANGVAVLASKQGYHSLTVAQKFVYDNYVAPLIKNMEFQETLEKM